LCSSLWRVYNLTDSSIQHCKLVFFIYTFHSDVGIYVFFRDLWLIYHHRRSSCRVYLHILRARALSRFAPYSVMHIRRTVLVPAPDGTVALAKLIIFCTDPFRSNACTAPAPSKDVFLGFLQRSARVRLLILVVISLCVASIELRFRFRGVCSAGVCCQCWLSALQCYFV
jgi:hypothetical protein